MGKLSRHVGKTIFGAIAVALLVLVGLDSVGAVIDQTADISRNYHFADVLIYVGTLLPSRIYEYMPFASLIGCLIVIYHILKTKLNSILECSFDYATIPTQ